MRRVQGFACDTLRYFETACETFILLFWFFFLLDGGTQWWLKRAFISDVYCTEICCVVLLQLPEEARELDKELRAITKEKNEAVRGQDFEKVHFHPAFKMRYVHYPHNGFRQMLWSFNHASVLMLQWFGWGYVNLLQHCSSSSAFCDRSFSIKWKHRKSGPVVRKANGWHEWAIIVSLS